MALQYSFLEYTSPVGCPGRTVNGGLYTGEPAKGPWGNVPVTPEPNALAQNLLSAKPPPGAEKIPMSTERPGNNHITLPYHRKLDSIHNIQCINT